jgi:tetratricopeptide (TPR) repeat protein
MASRLRRLLTNLRSGVAVGTVGAYGAGIAAGRDIHHNTINVGLGAKEVERRLAEAQRPLLDRIAELIDQIAREKGIPAAALRSILAKLGQSEVAEHEIVSRLNAAADQLIELRANVARLSGDRPELAAIREQVLALLDRGDLDGARAALNASRQAARTLGLHSSRMEVELLANEAFIDELQLAYRAAETKYDQSASLVREFDPEGEWGLRMHQADALSRLGSEFGDATALTDAIAIYERCLALAPRSTRPLDWANTQDSLGIANSKLGERNSTTEALRTAIACHEEALKEYTRQRVPRDWAGTKNNIGNALAVLGEGEQDIDLLKSASAAYRDALLECTRERDPLEWANIQSNLGNTLQIIGKLTANVERLEESEKCYRVALLERTRKRTPLDWATTQNNLGNTLSDLAVLTRSVARLKASIECFLEALKERTLERVPLDWAMTVGNVGVTLLQFGMIERSPGRIESAIDALQDALDVFERLGADRYVAGTKRNLSHARTILSQCRR